LHSAKPYACMDTAKAKLVKKTKLVLKIALI